MKKIFLLLVFVSLSFTAESFQAVQAPQKMDWERAVRFCFNIGGRMPTVEQIEIAYNYKEKGQNADYTSTIYWTRTDIDIESAMSFDFAIGLAYPDHKANKYSVMCVR